MKQQGQSWCDKSFFTKFLKLKSLKTITTVFVPKNLQKIKQKSWFFELFCLTPFSASEACGLLIKTKLEIKIGKYFKIVNEDDYII